MGNRTKDHGALELCDTVDTRKTATKVGNSSTNHMLTSGENFLYLQQIWERILEDILREHTTCWTLCSRSR